jgi:hypothetical protein
MCPAEEPSHGESCDMPGTACAYGPLTCHCMPDAVWDCGTCPDPAPDDQSGCTYPGLGCDYADGLHCACADGAWTCEAPCPTDEPAPGSPCVNGEGQQCAYGATACLCVNHQFFCN